MKSSAISLLFALAVILSSCGTPRTMPKASSPSEIRDPQTDTTYTEIWIQEVRTSNCDGANPTTTVSRSLTQEQTTFFEVVVEAGGLLRGTPIPGLLEAELEAKIKTALGSSLGSISGQAISTVLETPSGQALIHEIAWNETKVRGTIELVYQDGTAIIDFEKIARIELFGRTSESLSCDGQTATRQSSPTIAAAITAATSTVEISTAVVSPPTQAPTPIEETPIREQYQVTVGDGLFESGAFSDGLAPYSENWLWDNDHFNIQRIRKEEYPSGCDVSRYNTNRVWISGSAGMQLTINDQVVGTYRIADDAHGYVFQWPIRMGDKLCAVNSKPIGFLIILGPDIYYHYDSYCYRGNC